MAGLFPDVPGTRFAYDTDGTVMRTKNPNLTFRTITGAEAARMNDESHTDVTKIMSNDDPNQQVQGTTASPYFFTLVFPQLRNLSGYYARAYTQAQTAVTGSKGALQWSGDTTDGSDGTWTQVEATFTGVIDGSNNLAGAVTGYGGTVRPDYRTAITPLALTNVKGLRFGFLTNSAGTSPNDHNGFKALHLYGTIVGATSGLQFWHPTLDQPLAGAHFDFGDISQGTIGGIKQFRIKNTHTTAAATITIGAAANGSSDALMAQGLAFSLDNITYAATASLASLAAGAISPLIYVRRTVGAAEAANQRSARITASAASFA